jgi:hypothetical protein
LGAQSRFKGRRYVNLGPFTSYGAGLYLAEGTTDKNTIMHFHERSEENSKGALSFNSSEGTSLAIFLQIGECLGFAQEAILSWKIKVGSAFMYEVQVLGEIFQSPMVRKKEKGQGKSPSCVQPGYFREWAIKEFSELGGAASKFSHLEFTGAGVPRVQVNCSRSPARLLFSLHMLAIGSLLDLG